MDSGHIIDKHYRSVYRKSLAILTRQAEKENISVSKLLEMRISQYANTKSVNNRYDELISELNSLLKTDPNSDIIKLLKDKGALI